MTLKLYQVNIATVLTQAQKGGMVYADQDFYGNDFWRNQRPEPGTNRYGTDKKSERLCKDRRCKSAMAPIFSC